MTVSITKPGEKKATTMSYSKAKTYVFNKAGTYTVKYTVKNSNKPYKSASKTVKVIVKNYKDAELNVEPNTFAMTVKDGAFDAAKDSLKKEILKAVSIMDNGATISAEKAAVDLSKVKSTEGTYDVTVSYKGKSGKTVTKSVKVNVTVETTNPTVPTTAVTAATTASTN
jgi:PKD repeat protein